MSGDQLAVGGGGDSDFREIWTNLNVRTSSITFFPQRNAEPTWKTSSDSDNVTATTTTSTTTTNNNNNIKSNATSVVKSIKEQILSCKAKLTSGYNKHKTITENTESSEISQEIVFDGMKEDKKHSMLEFLQSLGLYPDVTTKKDETVIVLDISTLPQQGISKSTFVEYLKERIQKDCSSMSHKTVAVSPSSKSNLTIESGRSKVKIVTPTIEENKSSSTVKERSTISSSSCRKRSENYNQKEISTLESNPERHYFCGHIQRGNDEASIYRVGISSMPNSENYENLESTSKETESEQSNKKKIGKTKTFLGLSKFFNKIRKKRKPTIVQKETDNFKQDIKLCSLFAESKISLIKQSTSASTQNIISSLSSSSSKQPCTQPFSKDTTINTRIRFNDNLNVKENKFTNSRDNYDRIQMEALKATTDDKLLLDDPIFFTKFLSAVKKLKNLERKSLCDRSVMTVDNQFNNNCPNPVNYDDNNNNNRWCSFETARNYFGNGSMENNQSYNSIKTQEGGCCHNIGHCLGAFLKKQSNKS